jgi:hypothetical protein
MTLTAESAIAAPTAIDQSLRESAVSLPRHLSRPDLLLSPRIITPGSVMPAAMQIMHAATAFDGGAFNDRGELNPRVDRYARQLHAQGFDCLWCPGTWQHSGPAEMMARYHAAYHWRTTEWGNGSTFAVDSYDKPIPQIGNSLQDLGRLSWLFGERGVQLAACYVTNAWGILSKLMREHPDFIIPVWLPQSKTGEFDHFRELDARAGHTDYLWERAVGKQDYQQYTWAVYQRTDKRLLWEDKVEYPAAMASPGAFELRMIPLSLNDSLFAHTYYPSDPNQPKWTAYQLLTPYGMGDYFWAYRWTREDGGFKHSDAHFCMKYGTDRPYDDGPMIGEHPSRGDDTAALNTRDPRVLDFAANQQNQLLNHIPILRADLAHVYSRGGWEHNMPRIRQRHGSRPVVISETYNGDDGWAKEVGLAPYAPHVYKSLVEAARRSGQPDFAALMHWVHDSPGFREFVKRGPSVSYTWNQDEERIENPLIAGAVATVMCALPLQIRMEAQGQKYGVQFRASAQAQFSWEAWRGMELEALTADPEHAAFWRKLNRLMAKGLFCEAAPPANTWGRAAVGIRDASGCNVIDLSRDSAIFHIVRQRHLLDGNWERALVVVDKWERPIPLEVDLTQSFGLSPGDLGGYSMVSPLTRQVRDAVPCFQLPGGPYTSHMWLLAPKNEVDRRLIEYKQLLDKVHPAIRRRS